MRDTSASCYHHWRFNQTIIPPAYRWWIIKRVWAGYQPAGGMARLLAPFSKSDLEAQRTSRKVSTPFSTVRIFPATRMVARSMNSRYSAPTKQWRMVHVWCHLCLAAALISHETGSIGWCWNRCMPREKNVNLFEVGNFKLKCNRGEMLLVAQYIQNKLGRLSYCGLPQAIWYAEKREHKKHCAPSLF